MSISSQYAKKRVSADQAVAIVKSGDWVEYGHFALAPFTLDAALAKRVGDLRDVKVRAVLFPGLAAVATVDPTQESFVFNNWHFGRGERALAARGLCYHVPQLYHEAPLNVQHLDIDVFMTSASSMDKNGYFNFGVSNSSTRALMDRARNIIIEVNENVPYCYGGYNERIHISEVHSVVESDQQALTCVPATAPDAADRAVALQIVEVMEDRSCIQLGIGAMPNAVGSLIAQSDLKDIGVHTEMLVDAYLEMHEAGKITNRYKALDPGKITYTFALGSKKLYDFIDCNASCSSYSVDYTNDPLNIAKNDRFVAINNAAEVDLYGQVSSESSGFRQLTGTGGQFDFIFGAYHSKGGKPFICLKSTRKDSEGNLQSRIRPFLDHGTIVTVPRTVTDYVVTEYGMAKLKGKSTWQRAEELINIAHPYFRDELVQRAENQGIWRKCNKKDI